MKARLGELQARLESHESRRSQSAEASDGGNNTLNALTAAPFPPTNKHDGTNSNHAPTTANAAAALDDKTGAQQLPPQQAMHFMQQQPNLYEQPVDDPENTLFPQMANPHHSNMLSSPPPSQPSPTSHGLLSPPTHPDQQAAQQGQQGSRGGKNSQDFMVDCLRFQSQLLNKLHNLQQETGFPGPFPGAVHSTFLFLFFFSCFLLYL